MKHRNPIENFKQINKSILSSRNLRDQNLEDDKDKTLQKEMQTSTKALEQEAEIQISLEKYA